MADLHIVKIGGNVLKDEVGLEETLSHLGSLNESLILVHGGGKQVDQWLERLGNKPVMVDGRRITDALSLDLAVMNYAGLINKQLVASLQARGKNALGMSGADLNSIRSVKRIHPTIDFGYVGDIEEVNRDAFVGLLERGITPVCCAITMDKRGQLLNTNADTIAASIAMALAKTWKVTLWYCFEKKGVLSDLHDEHSVVEILSREKYEQMVNEKQIHTGMLPKLTNCFAALDQGVEAIYITDQAGIRTIPHSSGTKITQ